MLMDATSTRTTSDAAVPALGRCSSTAIVRPSGDQRGALNCVSGSEIRVVIARSGVVPASRLASGFSRTNTRSRRPDFCCTHTIVVPSGERSGSSSRASDVSRVTRPFDRDQA